VRVPLRRNSEGIDVAVDTDLDSSIYSGMTKRMARQDGHFSMPGGRPDTKPEDLL
jgi:hypothetical protein